MAGRDGWDVVVVGLGALGAAALHRAALAGARVVGLEQHAPGHDRGSSHGATRIFRRALFEHPAYLPVVDRSLELWREIEAASPRHVFDERVGLVLAGAPDGAVVRGTLAVASRAGLPIERLDASESARRFPTIAVPEGFATLWDPDGAILRPEQAVLAQVEAARGLGALVGEREQVRGWARDGAGVAVTTSRRVLRAGRLVVAAGPWAARLLGPLGAPLRLLRKTLFWHRPVDEPAWRLGVAPLFALELPTGFLYGFPAIDRRGVKIADHAGGRAMARPEPGADLAPGEAEAVQRLAARVLRGLAPRAHEHAACTYTMTADGHPLVGFHPEDERVLVAAGFSGHGFKHSVALGEALADLALGRPSRLDLALFAPGRFA